MAVNRVTCPAGRELVFRALSTPRDYGYFVVGNRTVRRFDPTWPEPGSELHHSLGFGITLIRDRTESLEVIDGKRIAMRTYLRPLAINDVVFELRPSGDGTLVEITETLVGGPAHGTPLAPIADMLIQLRNGLLCRRLRRVIEGRTARLESGASTGESTASRA